MVGNVYISLGSNVGDRENYLRSARQKFSVQKASQVYETEPWPADESDRQWFLNQVLEVDTDLPPEDLLDFCKQIESELGRSDAPRWGDREIDVDILLYNDFILDSEKLTIPHRHLQERRFILVPLTEIARDLSDPITGELYTIILKNLGDEHKVRPFKS